MTKVNDELEQLLSNFTHLNPFQVQASERLLLNYRSSDPHGDFMHLESFTVELINKYLESPIKQNEKLLLADYFHMIEQKHSVVIETFSRSHALIPSTVYRERDWMKLVQSANIPRELITAVEAAQARNKRVESVFTDLFDLMFRVNRDATMNWVDDFLKGDELDPDLLRDICKSLQKQQNVPDHISHKIVEWTSNERLIRHWPQLIIEADKFLRIQALNKWLKRANHFKLATQLKALHPYNNDEHLKRWLHQAISEMGESLHFFSQQADALKQNDLEDWRRKSLYQELIWLSRIFEPIIIVSDLLLDSAHGAKRFAMSIFGFTSQYEKHWRKELIDHSAKAIRKCFIRDFMKKKSPLDTIHTLCFGDQELELSIMKELDLYKEDFDNIKQRELVVEKLSYVYASYRETGLFKQEISRRYRRLMRTLHDDLLANLLHKEEFEQIKEYRDILNDLSSIASESRRYLQYRQSMDKETEEILVADMEFALSVRKLRGRYLNSMLK